MRFNTLTATSLAEGIRLATDEPTDLAIVATHLPDGSGIDNLLRIHEHRSNLPVVMLADPGEQRLGPVAIREGAQDVWIMGEIDAADLVRRTIYAFERHALWSRIKSQTLQDELTGLYNQRGFFTLAAEYQAIARRNRKRMMVLFIDLDGLKAINDAYGHAEGSRAIVAAGSVLEKTFRENALISRWGGDEFVVLLTDADELTEEVVADKLYGELTKFNTRMRRGYDLSMSIGFAHFDPEDPKQIDELLRRADVAMYETKRARKTLREDYENGSRF